MAERRASKRSLTIASTQKTTLASEELLVTPKHAGGRPLGPGKPRSGSGGFTMQWSARSKNAMVKNLGWHATKLCTTMQTFKPTLEQCGTLFYDTTATEQRQLKAYLALRRKNNGRVVLPEASRRRTTSSELNDRKDESAQALKRHRHKEVLHVSGGDVAGLMVTELRSNPDLLKEILLNALELFEATDAFVAFKDPLTYQEALEAKMGANLSDTAYRFLRKMLPKGYLPSIKAVTKQKWARSEKMQLIPGVPDSAMVLDHVQLLLDDVRHRPPMTRPETRRRIFS